MILLHRLLHLLMLDFHLDRNCCSLCGQMVARRFVSLVDHAGYVMVFSIDSMEEEGVDGLWLTRSITTCRP